MFRIGLVQMRCEKGAIHENLRTISHYLDEATARGIDLIGFPEMSITGYTDPTKYPEAKLRLDGPEVAHFLQLTRAFLGTVLAGLIEDNSTEKPFITQIAARRGQLLGAYRKKTIQQEEVEWFSAGDGLRVFQHGEVTFGIAICADIESETIFRNVPDRARGLCWNWRHQGYTENKRRETGDRDMRGGKASVRST